MLSNNFLDNVYGEIRIFHDTFSALSLDHLKSKIRHGTRASEWAFLSGIKGVSSRLCEVNTSHASREMLAYPDAQNALFLTVNALNFLDVRVFYPDICIVLRSILETESRCYAN